MKRIHLVVIALLSLTGLTDCASTRSPNSEKATTSVAFSPDHSLLAFGDATEIQVLEVGSGAQIATLRQLPKDIERADPGLFRHGVGDTLVFLDDARIASTGMGGLVTIWDIRSGRRLSIIEPPSAEEFASTIDFSRVTHRLVIGTSGGQVLLTALDGVDAGPLVPVANLEAYVWDLQFGEDGRYFASASMEPDVPVETSGDGDDSHPATGEVDEKSGPRISGGPADRSRVTIWDAQQLEKVGDLEGADGVTALALVPRERALLTIGEDLRVWEFLTLEEAGLIKDPNMAMQYFGVGTLVTVSVLGMAAGAALGAVYVPPELLFLPLAPMLRADKACLRAAAISPDGHSIVSTTKGPSHNVMAVIDRARNKVVEKWTADLYVCDMEFSSDGKYLLTATSDGVYMYDTATWKKTRLRDTVDD